MSSQSKRTGGGVSSAGVASGGGSGGGSRQISSATAVVGSGLSSKDELLRQEEQYKSENAELEKKTATLVYEAEQMLRANERLLNDTDFLTRYSDYTNTSATTVPVSRSAGPAAGRTNVSVASGQARLAASAIGFKTPLGATASELSAFKKTISNLERGAHSRTNNLTETSTDIGAQGVSIGIGELALDDYDCGNNDDDATGNDTERHSVMPRAAAEMSSEAQIRFLKAKVKVLQEELERAAAELTSRDADNGRLAQRCKELDEERAKQLRISTAHQTQLEKSRKQAEEASARATQLDAQLQAARKELDLVRRDAKKQQQDQQQLELRLARTLDEVDKYKAVAGRVQASTRDCVEQDKRKFEALHADNKRLHKQKLELIQAFKKQLKLIDILKRQKMHLEAARILQFTEEEFMNALEWNYNSNAPPPPPQKTTHGSAGGVCGTAKAVSNSKIRQISDRSDAAGASNRLVAAVKQQQKQQASGKPPPLGKSDVAYRNHNTNASVIRQLDEDGDENGDCEDNAFYELTENEQMENNDEQYDYLRDGDSVDDDRQHTNDTNTEATIEAAQRALSRKPAAYTDVHEANLDYQL